MGNVNTGIGKCKYGNFDRFLRTRDAAEVKKRSNNVWTNFVCKAASSKQFYYLRFTSKYTEREQRERSMFS